MKDRRFKKNIIKQKWVFYYYQITQKLKLYQQRRKCGGIHMIIAASSKNVQVDKYLEAGALSNTYLNEAKLTVGVLLFLRRRVRL